MPHSGSYACSNQYSGERRISKFEAFRAELEPTERKSLDEKLTRWIQTLNAKHNKGGFGIKQAEELFIALIEFDGVAK